MYVPRSGKMSNSFWRSRPISLKSCEKRSDESVMASIHVSRTSSTRSARYPPRTVKRARQAARPRTGSTPTTVISALPALMKPNLTS